MYKVKLRWKEFRALCYNVHVKLVQDKLVDISLQ